MTIKYLIRKEFIQIRRNAFLPRLIVMFPVMIMCVMPWVMNMEVKNIVVDIVDHDRSTLSAQLTHRLEASDYFIFGGQKPNYQAAMSDIERSKADVIVEIPPRYEKDLLLGQQPRILVAANAINGTKGNMSTAYLNSIIGQQTADISSQGSTVASATNAEGLTSILYLYNKRLNYKLFMIPSLIAILMMMLCGFLPALNIVGEKESGTLDAINVTPVSKWSFILAKLIPYWLIALVVMTICFVLSWAIYGITSAGSLWLVYLLSMLLAFTFSGLGLIISNYNETMQQAVFVMWFIVVNFILLSGLFTPVRSMPHWAYLTTYVNPMHYFIDAIRTAFVRGGDFGCVAHQVLALSIFAVLVNLGAIASYKK